MRNAYATLFLALIFVFISSIASAQIGAIDASFAPAGSGVSGQVNTVVVQPDGKVLIGGSFTSYNGTTRNRIARLNVDGTLDMTFNPAQGFNNDVNSIALQSSGKIIVGGKFTSYDGQNAGRYVRLNADGTRDATFYEAMNGDLNNDVEVLVVLPSDDILMGGSFTALESSFFAPIIKIKAEGLIDYSFNPGTFSSLAVVKAIAVQSDGKIMIGGEFTSIGGNSAKRIARIKSDGSFDGSFISGSGFDATVNAIVIQAGDKIVVGGDFSSYNGTSTNHICRLSTTGVLEAGFTDGLSFDSDVTAMALQSNGQIVIGGKFQWINDTVSRNYIARIDAEGLLDMTFDPGTGFNTDVTSISIMVSDGRVVAGGAFNSFNGTTRKFVARLLNHSIKIQSLNPTAPWCPGSFVEFIYSITGTYNASNTFHAVLSDATGSFTTPISIGITSGTSAGSIYATIPVATALGTSYAVRVGSTDPPSVSEDPLALFSGLEVTSTTPSVSITASPSGAVCSNSSVTYTATVVNGGTPSYVWYRNGVAIGTNSSTYVDNMHTQGDEIYCEATSTATCASPAMVTSNSIFMTVNATTTPSATVTANPTGQLCDGTSMTFTAVALNAGVTPSYQWKLNNVNVGTNSSTFSSAALVDGDQVKCRVTSTAACPSQAAITSNTITVDMIPIVTPTVSISSDLGSSICAGTSVTFTAATTNEGIEPVYSWMINSVDQGVLSTTFSTNSLVDGDQISFSLSNTDVCAINSPFFSNTIGMTVTAIDVPAVSISATPNGSVCAGTAIAFSASALSAGTVSYQWRVNNINIGPNLPNYSNAALLDGDQVKCRVTSTAPCPSPTPVNSNTITVDIIPVVTPSGSISSDLGNTICAGSTVTYTATPTNVGIAPTYLWTVNGVDQGEPSTTFITNTLNNGDVVLLTITNNDLCADPSPVTTNSITMTVIPVEIPTISITANPSGVVCDGTDIAFTANYGSAGNFPSFQWTVNGNSTGINSDIFNDATLSNGDVVQCTVVSNAACPDPTSEISNSIVINELPIVVPSISLSSDLGTTICDGTAVTFTATATNEGSSPVYTWFLNTVALVQSGSTYVTSSLVDGDVVECGITNNDACVVPSSAISNSIAMTVIPVEVPMVSISSDAGTPLCDGTNVTFIATADNAGPSPTYQWEVDGNLVGTDSDTYADATLVNDAVVICTITSNSPCPTTPTASSNTITMTFDATEALSVSISSSPSGPVCIGTEITFTADAASALATPTYQWTVNGTAVGSDAPTYSDATLVNDDVVQCTVTSNAACPSIGSANSNDITIVITATEVPSITISSDAAGQVCDGTTITFTANAISSGVNPTYAWELNTIPIGSNSPTFASALLADGDVITCTVTSNSACANPTFALSNSITVDIAPNITPTVFVLSDLGTTICQNADVTFSAVVANEGAAPTYAWLVDGVDVGVSTDTYATNTLTADASIECILTNTDACAVPASVTSVALAMTVVAVPSSPISISGNTVVCQDGAESYNVADVAGATSYTWTLPSGWSGISTTNTIAASVGLTGGVITITANNGCGSSAQQTLNVAVNPNYSTYSGTVTIDGDLVTSGWVFVLKQLIDGVDGWEKVDSAAIGIDGSYLFAELPTYSLPFILKAVASNVDFPTCVPTYYAAEGMNYQWDDENYTYALISDCGGVHVKDIAMVTTSGSQDGICAISGTVVNITGGKMALTDPIPGVDVVVEKVPPGNAFIYEPTDAFGKYRFEDMPVLPLPSDRYRIYISVPGIPMFDTYSIDVNPSDTAFSQLDFFLDLETNFIYIDNPNGIKEGLTVVDELRLLPNPMHDRMTVILPANFGVATSYQVLGIDGKVVQVRSLSGEDAVIVNRGDLPNGIYFLEVTNTQGLRRAAKVVVQ